MLTAPRNGHVPPPQFSVVVPLAISSARLKLLPGSSVTEPFRRRIPGPEVEPQFASIAGVALPSRVKTTPLLIVSVRSHDTVRLWTVTAELTVGSLTTS
jgi:hypothetical protein